MRAEDVRKRQGERLAAARKAAGYRSAREAALANAWQEGTYRSHEKGRRTIGQDDAERYARRFRVRGVKITAQEILFGGDADDSSLSAPDRQVIPIMGYVGAGGDVEPEFEQVPYDGLEQIEIPERIGLVLDPIGFLVRGESMMPRYNDGDIVVVEREQPWATDSMIGDEAVVRTYDGHRFLKRIKKGTRPHTYNLVSVRDAPTIESVRIAWASPVKLIIPNVGLRRVAPRPRPLARAHRERHK